MRRSKNGRSRLSKKHYIKRKKIIYGKGRFSALRNLIKGGLKFF